MYRCFFFPYRDDLRSMLYDNRPHGYPLNFLYTEYTDPVMVMPLRHTRYAKNPQYHTSSLNRFSYMY